MFATRVPIQNLKMGLQLDTYSKQCNTDRVSACISQTVVIWRMSHEMRRIYDVIMTIISFFLLTVFTVPTIT